MESANKIIQGLWICEKGGLLSPLELLCLHSFVAHGHEFHLYIYDEIANIPDLPQIKTMNANDVLPRKTIAANSQGSLAGYSDWFRWELLRQKGGWWVDMDIVCLRPFDFPEEIVVGHETGYLNLPSECSNAIVKYPRSHPLVSGMAENCWHPTRIMPWNNAKIRRRKIVKKIRFWRNPADNIGWGGAGGSQEHFAALKYFGLTQYIKPFHVFYPVSYNMTSCFYNETFPAAMWEEMLKVPHALHMGNEDLRQLGIDKTATFPANSLYEILKRRYLPS